MHAAVAILYDTSGRVNLAGDIRSLSSIYFFFFLATSIRTESLFSKMFLYVSCCFCNSKQIKNFGFLYSKSSKRHLVQTVFDSLQHNTNTQKIILGIPPSNRFKHCLLCIKNDKCHHPPHLVLLHTLISSAWGISSNMVIHQEKTAAVNSPPQIPLQASYHPTATGKIIILNVSLLSFCQLCRGNISV